MTAEPVKERPFNLLRWFSMLSLVSIGLFSAASALFLSRFLTDKMLTRDAVVSMQFIESIVEAENTGAYFVRRDQGRTNAALESFFRDISRLPDVFRANVYALDRSILWSSTQDLIGHRFGANPEFEEAFAGELAVESGVVGIDDKTEHVSFDSLSKGTRFMEAYVPIWDRDSHAVVGVVEIYKLPSALFLAIDEGHRLVWTSAAIGGLFLYATLFWIVRRAGRVMRAQQDRLVESETLAAMGEMASAVAHGIRNPLASI